MDIKPVNHELLSSPNTFLSLLYKRCLQKSVGQCLQKSVGRCRQTSVGRCLQKYVVTFSQTMYRMGPVGCKRCLQKSVVTFAQIIN